jgi:hypothetical protein
MRGFPYPGERRRPGLNNRSACPRGEQRGCPPNRSQRRPVAQVLSRAHRTSRANAGGPASPLVSGVTRRPWGCHGSPPPRREGAGGGDACSPVATAEPTGEGLAAGNAPHRSGPEASRCTARRRQPLGACGPGAPGGSARRGTPRPSPRDVPGGRRSCRTSGGQTVHSGGTNTRGSAPLLPSSPGTFPSRHLARRS